MRLSKNKAKNAVTLCIVAVSCITTFLFYQYWTPRKSISPNKPTPTYQTVTITPVNLNDPDSTLYFGDAKKVYSLALDGTMPQEIASLPYNVSSVHIDTKGNLLVKTDNSIYEKIINGAGGNTEYRQTKSDYQIWLLNPKEKVTTQIGEEIAAEEIYTKELPNGQAEIILDKHDGSSPTKIGLLRQKLISQSCGYTPCPSKRHPSRFIPSFDGKLLLSTTGGGGGLGEEAVVVSRDGSTVYPIDFYWYVSSALWIGNNVLLTQSQEGKQQIITFAEGGKFTVKELTTDLQGEFSFGWMSPSREILYTSDSGYKNSLYAIKNDTVTPIERLTNYQLKQELNLAEEEISTSSLSFVGWNSQSNKVVYAQSLGAISGSHDNDRTIREVIKLYDLNTGLTHTLATLHPRSSDPDDHLLRRTPISSISDFAFK